MAESTGNIQPQLDLSQHDATGGVDTKRILLYGWDTANLVKRRIATDENGNIKVNLTGAGLDAQFLTLSASGDLANERVFTPDTTNSFTVADGGAGNAYDISLKNVVTAGSATNASITVDAKGRVTAFSTGAVSAFATGAGDTGSFGAVGAGTYAIVGGEGIDTSAATDGFGGGVVTISGEDASISNKGIASFNSTNFSVSSGAVNTIQNINTTASVQFNDLNLFSGKGTWNPSVSVSTNSTAMVWDTNGTITASQGFGATPGYKWLEIKENGTTLAWIDDSAGNATRLYSTRRWDFESAGQMFFTGTQFFFQAHFSVNRTGDANSTANQKDSYGMYFQNSLWTGSAASQRFMEIRAKASTTVNLDQSLVFFSSVTGGVGTDGTEAMRIYWQNATSLNLIGIGVSAPTAALHIKAGTTAAGTAPLKLTTGTSMTAAEDGAFEFTNPTLYFTCNSAVRHEIVLDHPTNGALITSGIVHGVESTGTGHLTVRGGNGLSGKIPTAGSNTFVTAGAGTASTAGGKVDIFTGTDNGGGTGSVSILQSDGTTKIIEVDDTGLGFYAASPVAQQTGVAVTAAGIHAALVNLGLITA